MDYEHQEIDTVLPHSYPRWIKISTLFCFSIFLFSLTKITQLRQIPAQIQFGEQLFAKKAYRQAISIFSDILEKHPYCDKARIRLAQSHYIVGNKEISMQYIANREFTRWKYHQLCMHIPEPVLNIYGVHKIEKQT